MCGNTSVCKIDPKDNDCKLMVTHLEQEFRNIYKKKKTEIIDKTEHCGEFTIFLQNILIKISFNPIENNHTIELCLSFDWLLLKKKKKKE